MRVDNAIIMAAGTSSRFAPLSFEKHKAMTVVKGEVLIERQIRQIKDAGIRDVVIVTGYKAEQFDYLVPKYGVQLIHNPDYLTRNNNGSIWAARGYLNNSYICSADNYFAENPFENEVSDCYYAAEYANGHTEEWCMQEDAEGNICSVSIGGDNSWYMLGHTFWSDVFSSKFLSILSNEYEMDETKDKLWEKIFIEHLDELKMKIRKYQPGMIYEFDTLDELRVFDKSYISDTRSSILKKVSKSIGIEERDIRGVRRLQGGNCEAVGFEFDCPAGHFFYVYETEMLTKGEKSNG